MLWLARGLIFGICQMPVVRTYHCEDCGETFDVTHEFSAEPDPDCPYCKIVMQWRPQGFSIKTNKSRAYDLTQDILNKDFGLDDFNDNTRPGDIVAKMPVETRQHREEKEQIEREVTQMHDEIMQNPASVGERQLLNAHPNQQAAVRGFWGGPSGGNVSPMVAQTLVASAKAGPQARLDPMKGMAELGKTGQLPTNFKIIARARAD
jgi:DNA-directed RNA polymerase subunit RPC12/RpoP